jgi:uncharacterized protein YlxP (DUF503 family)
VIFWKPDQRLHIHLFIPVGVLFLNIQIPGCTSLKEKRRRLKPLLARLHKEFNISVAEIGLQDAWQEAVIACALVSNDNGYTQRALQLVTEWVESYWKDVSVIDERLEII